jgi:deoxyribonuclease V
MAVRKFSPGRITPRAAMRLQSDWAGQVSLRRLARPVHRIAGADVSYDSGSCRFVSALVVLGWPGLEVLETASAQGPIRFPYVPGLLSFREVPPLLRAFRKLRSRPDLILCDGQGLAHPRFFGLACHLGLLLEIPTIGVAKKRLVGEHPPVPPMRGGKVPLTYAGRRVGTVLRTRSDTRPLFVSPGHRISIAEAASWALRCAKGYRLPEPTRLADREVARIRRRLAVSR